MIILLKNQKVDTTGTQETFYYSSVNDNKRGLLTVTGTFDGATIGIEIKPPEETEWIPVSDSQFTVQADPVIINGGGFDIRGALSGAGASTDLTLKITGTKP